MKMTEKQELLTILMEECSEVAIEAAKIIRFSNDDQKHCDTLESEIGDLLCMVKLLEEHQFIRMSNVEHCIDAKREKLKKME
jgi:NTP pyrophosphatase (non-canonical NTP hydrolase)